MKEAVGNGGRKRKIRSDNKRSERSRERISAECGCVIRSCINLKAYFNKNPSGSSERRRSRDGSHAG